MLIKLPVVPEVDLAPDELRIWRAEQSKWLLGLFVELFLNSMYEIPRDVGCCIQVKTVCLKNLLFEFLFEAFRKLRIDRVRITCTDDKLIFE
jgi:hypothetical protein